MSQGVGRSEERERGREKEEGLFGGAVRTHTMFTNSNNHSSNSEDHHNRYNDEKFKIL